jgi:hypothetical protein
LQWQVGQADFNNFTNHHLVLIAKKEGCALMVMIQRKKKENLRAICVHFKGLYKADIAQYTLGDFPILNDGALQLA